MSKKLTLKSVRPQDGPQMLQESLEDPIWTMFGRLFIQCSTPEKQKITEFASVLYGSLKSSSGGDYRF